jgi:hypothetical protein
MLSSFGSDAMFLNSNRNDANARRCKCRSDVEKALGRVLIMDCGAGRIRILKDEMLRSSLKIRLWKRRPVLVCGMRCIFRHNPSPVIVPFP